MPLLNEFKLGADPEFVIVNNGHLQQYAGRVAPYAPWGLDHSNWVIEPHPKPDPSVRALVHNIRASMNDFAIRAPLGAWRAGSYIEAPERTVTLGGHVHIDQPNYTPAQQESMDLFTQYLERLDILPRAESEQRRQSGTGYGRFGDFRREHGHFEYRSMGSWLYSQRVTKLCLAGLKLIMVDPEAVPATLHTPTRASLIGLRSFYERFKHRDDDIDWILDSGILGKKLQVRPDRDLREVWRVIPAEEKPHWKEEEARRLAAIAPPRVPMPQETTPLNTGVGVWPFNTIAIRNHVYWAAGGLRPALVEGLARYLDTLVGMGLPEPQPGVSFRTDPLGVVFQCVGIVGQPWFAVRYGHTTLRTTIDGRPYGFWILPSAAASIEGRELARAILRRAVRNGTIGGQGVIGYAETLMFQLQEVGPTQNNVEF